MTTSARAQALEAAHGDEAGIARAGADQIDAVRHGWIPSTAACARCTSARMSPAPPPGARRPPACRALRPARIDPDADARTIRPPSGETTTPRQRQSSVRDLCAYAPIGIWHPPPSRADDRAFGAQRHRRRPRRRSWHHVRARARIVVADLDGDDALTRRRHADVGRKRRRDPVGSSPAVAGRPRPGRARRSRRSRACAGAYRGSREPAETVRPGNSRVSCAIRRTLLVPIRGARPSVADDLLIEQSGQPAAVELGQHDAHRAGPRAAAPPRRAGRPGAAAGMSLLLWTARSISPASSASSISFTKRRLPPICDEAGVGQPVAGRLDDDDLARHASRVAAAAPRPRSPETARARCRASRA